MFVLSVCLKCLLTSGNTLTFQDDTKFKTKPNMLLWLVCCWSYWCSCVTDEFVKGILCLQSTFQYLVKWVSWEYWIMRKIRKYRYYCVFWKAKCRRRQWFCTGSDLGPACLMSRWVLEWVFQRCLFKLCFPVSWFVGSLITHLLCRSCFVPGIHKACAWH